VEGAVVVMVERAAGLESVVATMIQGSIAVADIFL
jgi:hypothetical protein